MDRIRLSIYLGTIIWKINIIVSLTTFDASALNLISGIVVLNDSFMAPMIANAALYWRDSILLERDSLRGWS